jgi:hypothetical protein
MINDMDLTNFKKTDKVITATMLLSVTFNIIMAAAFCLAFFYMTGKIDKAYTKELVIDTSGKAYEATPILASEMKMYEYEDHIKSFVQSWYAFDESTYEKNINGALNWIGDRGKELLNEYNDINMYNSLIQKNIMYSVSISEIKINMNTIPLSGYVLFRQTGHRARGSISRDIYAEFTLYSVSRSRENIHGVKIENWKVTYSQPEN